MVAVSEVTVVAHSAAAMLLEMPAERRFVLLDVVASVLVRLLIAVAGIEPSSASTSTTRDLLGSAWYVLRLEAGVHLCAHHLREECLGNESYAPDARYDFTLRIVRIEALARINGHHARHGHHELHLLLLRELHRNLRLVL